MAKRSAGATAILKSIKTTSKTGSKSRIPTFRPGDSVKVHARIVEGSKERVQVFQGVVISRKGRNGPNATFTVRKVSYNVGVERIFLLHSPRIEKIEVLNSGIVRRAKLFYLRDVKGKAGKIRSKLLQTVGGEVLGTDEPQDAEASTAEAGKEEESGKNGKQANGASPKEEKTEEAESSAA